jgi:hypothetical protein
VSGLGPSYYRATHGIVSALYLTRVPMACTDANDTAGLPFLAPGPRDTDGEPEPRVAAELSALAAPSVAAMLSYRYFGLVDRDAVEPGNSAASCSSMAIRSPISWQRGTSDESGARIAH